MWVLDVMAEQGVISSEHATVARAMPLGLNKKRQVRDSYPAFLDLVRRQLRRDYREEDLTTRGLNIFTSFDPLLQRQVESSTAAVLDQLDPAGELESATVVTRFDTGEVAALVGGRKPRYAGFNRALDARRPAGSLLKPAIYLAALEQPGIYTLASILSDTPMKVRRPVGESWEPRNFDRQPHGEVPLYQSLAQSYNLATARLGLEIGLDTLVDMLARLGSGGGCRAGSCSDTGRRGSTRLCRWRPCTSPSQLVGFGCRCAVFEPLLTPTTNRCGATRWSTSAPPVLSLYICCTTVCELWFAKVPGAVFIAIWTMILMLRVKPEPPMMVEIPGSLAFPVIC